MNTGKANKSMEKNRRLRLPLGAEQKLGRAIRAPAFVSAAVAHLKR